MKQSNLIEKLIRCIVHFLLLNAFLAVADTILTATGSLIWKYTPLLVWLGGAIVYLILFFLGRSIAPRFWLFRK